MQILVAAPSPATDTIAADEHAMQDEASYYCDNCGEEIVVPVDLSGGADQTYVEDCPVCCHPQVINVRIDPSGDISLSGEAE